MGFKRNDSARGYLWHTGSDMELANTTAGTISFNTNSATRGSISSAGVWRLHNLAGTGDRVVVASSNGTLSASTSVTGLVDTTTLSTRAWRQKGDDSLGAIIATKGSGTVTSVATGYGLSGGTITTTGTLLVDTLNISTRAWRQKGLDSLAALEVSGSGTTNYVPKFTAASTIGNSQIFDNGTNVGIGTTFPTVKLDIVGSAGTVVRTKGGTGSAQGSAYYVQLAGSTNTLSAFGDRANIFGGTVDQIASIYTGSSIPLTFDVNTAERMRIFANGRVFVGASPTDAGYQFDINGTLRSVNGANFATTSGNVGIGTASPVGDGTALNIYGSSFASIKLQNSTSGAAATDGTDIVVASSDLLIKNRESGSIIAYTANTERGRINSAGEWLLNADGTDAGDYKLQVAGAIYNTSGAVFAASGGNVGIGTASATDSYSFGKALDMHGSNGAAFYMRYATDPTVQFGTIGYDRTGLGLYLSNNNALPIVFYTSNTQRGRINSAGEWIIDASGTDAGDYKLQVVGNARVGTGKLDIASNTTYGLGVSRSGTSEVAGQIFNSNGILYTGVESSAGGAIFTGSSAYAAVIGSGAAYPLQFATNNVTRATINTNGELLINTLTDNGDFKLQVNGNALISGSIKTANGGSSTAQPWHLGSVVATNVQLDTANYVEVEINGVYYRLAIVTPL